MGIWMNVLKRRFYEVSGCLLVHIYRLCRTFSNRWLARLFNKTDESAIPTAEQFCWRMNTSPSHRSDNPSIGIRKIASELFVGVGTVYKVLNADTVWSKKSFGVNRKLKNNIEPLHCTPKHCSTSEGSKTIVY